MPIHTENKGGSYLRGLADVKVRDDAQVLIRFENSDDVHSIMYDASTMGDIVDGKYRVTLSSDGSKLFSCVPANGVFVVRYDGMVAADGQLPAPKLIVGGKRKSKDGKKTWDAPDSLVFTVLLRIVSTPNKRLHIPYQLTYAFEEYKDTGETTVPLGNKAFDRTASFMEVAGMDFTKDSIPFKENILPFLDEFFRDKNLKFQCTVKDGYIDTVAPLPPVIEDD